MIIINKIFYRRELKLMEGTGIQPVMNMGGNDSFGFGNGGLWLFAILALMWGGNGGLFGNNGLGYRPATAEDVNNGFNFADLQDQNRDILTAINSGTAQAVAATNQAKYDNINVLKDVQNALQLQLGDIKTTEANIMSKQQECCCNTLRAIDGVNYNAAMNTAAINANTTAQIQKVLDTLSANKIDELQSKINRLELNNALSGVVRYPDTFAYNAGANPFCGCGYNTCNGNI